MPNNELNALISLLDDPDEKIFGEIRGKLISFGDHIIPHLETAWESSFDHLLQNRIENIIHHLQFATIKKELTNWKNSDRDIIDGAIIVSKYQYPDIEVAEIKNFIKEIT